MQRSLREDLALRGYDLAFEYKGSTIAVNTKEFTSEKEEAVYQKYGLKTLRWYEVVTLYNPEVWELSANYELTLIEDCLAPEQPFFTGAPCLQLEGIKDLRHWDVASATDLISMFDSCRYLKSLLLDGWDVSSVKDMQLMFGYCESLENLLLDGWYLSKDTNTDFMFKYCPVGINVAALKRRITPCSVF